MRVGALSDKTLGKFVNENFIATFQKVGTFKIIHGQKIGGNIVAYFLTPDKKVISAVGGPVPAQLLLKEARWAEGVWKTANEGLDEKKEDEKMKLRRMKDRIESEVKDRIKRDPGDKNYQYYYKHTYYFEDILANKVPHVIPVGLVVMFKETIPQVEKVYERVFNAVGEKVSDEEVKDDGKNPKKIKSWEKKIIED